MRQPEAVACQLFWMNPMRREDFRGTRAWASAKWGRLPFNRRKPALSDGRVLPRLGRRASLRWPRRLLTRCPPHPRGAWGSFPNMYASLSPGRRAGRIMGHRSGNIRHADRGQISTRVLAPARSPNLSPRTEAKGVGLNASHTFKFEILPTTTFTHSRNPGWATGQRPCCLDARVGCGETRNNLACHAASFGQFSRGPIKCRLLRRICGSLPSNLRGSDALVF